VTSWTPECEEAKKPAIGMQFKDLAEAEHFYKSYAHSVGFSVRKGQSRTVGNEQVWKRFYCNRRGWRSEKEEIKSKRKTKITRYDCQAMITLKWKDNKYIVTSFFEDHTHELASPSKQQFLRSNREVSESAKSSLFTCHTASIGTSAAYRLFRVGEGGFEKVGCTKRDFQNYHCYLKCAINTSDAQMFIDNLARRKEANPAFFFDYMLDEQEPYLMKMDKNVQKKAIFDEDGNLLEEKIKSPLDLEMQKKTSGARKDFEESIRLAAHSVETMDVVTTCLANLVDTVR
jgi:hypothetical protein